MKTDNNLRAKLTERGKSHSSVEETENLATDSLSFGFLVVHDALVGGQNHVAELAGGQHGVGEVLEVLQLKVETGGDDTALVEATVQLNDDLAGAGIIDDGEFADVALGLHQTENLDQHLGDWVKDNLNREN